MKTVCIIFGQALPSQSKQRNESPTSTKHKKMGFSLTYKKRLLSFKKGGRVRQVTGAPYGSLGPYGLTYEPIYKLMDLAFDQILGLQPSAPSFPTFSLRHSSSSPWV
ncbi:unnamed protein product [Prunus armeniaca]